MLRKTKNWPGKENHSWLHGSTVTCLSTVIIIKVLNNNITKITILLGEWGDGEKAKQSSTFGIDQILSKDCFWKKPCRTTWLFKIYVQLWLEINTTRGRKLLRGSGLVKKIKPGWKIIKCWNFKWNQKAVKTSISLYEKGHSRGNTNYGDLVMGGGEEITL